MSEQPSQLPTKVRFYELDFLRFIAAMAVLLFHYTFRMWNLDGGGQIVFPQLAAVTKYGYLGVDVFFLISGFVILLSVEGRSVKEFAISRVVRLYPAYWFSVIMTFLVMSYFEFNGYPYSWSDASVNMTMLQSWFHVSNISGVYWTLAAEFQFYVMVAVVLLLGWSRRFSLVLGIWLAISTLAYYVEMPQIFKQIFLVAWSHYFIAGACFYLIWRDGHSWYKSSLIGLSLFQALKLGYWYVGLKERLTSVAFDPVVVLVAISAFYALFYLVVLRKIPNCFKTLAKLGVLTYPLYLIHSMGEIALQAYMPVMNRQVLLILVTLVFIGFAYLVHRFVEKPFARLMKAFLTEPGLISQTNWRKRAAEVVND